MPCLILAYHRVLDDAPPEPLAVTSAALERQLSWLLQKGYRNVSLEQAAELRTQRRRQHSFAVTFDDGYLDTLENALDVLERLRLTATVFVVPRFADEASDQGSAFMSWEQIRELSSRGVEIGSHTMNHLFLSDLPDDELRAELVGSREAIADQLGAAPRSFCYPGGSADGSTSEKVAKAGYTLGVLTAPRLLGREDRFTLRRVGVYGQTGQTTLALKTGLLRRPLEAGVVASLRRVIRPSRP